MSRIEAPLTNFRKDVPLFLKGISLDHHFDTQISQKIAAGFADAVGMTEQGYVNQFHGLLYKGRDSEISSAIPVFVEPRIPFEKQADLLGVEIGPSVTQGYLPTSERFPYLAWVDVINNTGETPEEFAAHISQHANRPGHTVELASPFEALNTNFLELLSYRFIYLQGSSPTHPLALDTWLGQPRITVPERNKFDGLTAGLVSIK